MKSEMSTVHRPRGIDQRDHERHAVTTASADASRFDALANAPFVENRPTAETAQTLREELLFQRATQAYLWALPLINTLGMKFGSEKVFGEG